MKLPSLVSHYFEHRQNNSELSFFGFLCQHYQSDNTHTDDKNHKDLPFKSHECQHMGQVFVIVEFNDSKITEFPGIRTQTSEFRETVYHLDGLSSIWQPPQTA